MRSSMKWLVVFCLLLASTNMVDAQLARPVASDFDGDGTTDRAVYYPTLGNWYIWQSQSQSAKTIQWGFPGTEPVAADYDGDHITDVAVFYPPSGQWFIWESASQSSRIVQWGFYDAIPVPGDYDGDGRADPAVYYPLAGTWYILESSSGNMRTTQWGYLQAEPTPGYYDDDAKLDPGVYGTDSGNWYVLPGNDPDGATYFAAGFGLMDFPLVGYFDSDQLTDLAIYSLVNMSGGIEARWWLYESIVGYSSYSYTSWGFGAAEPVPGDYNGDGLTDTAVYHGQLGNWYILYSGSYTSQVLQWGFAGAIPTTRQLPDRLDRKSEFRLRDDSATFNITTVTLTDLKTGLPVSGIKSAGTFSLSPGIYELKVGYYGSKRVGIIKYVASGTKTRTFRHMSYGPTRFVLTGGSISGVTYKSPSLTEE